MWIFIAILYQYFYVCQDEKLFWMMWQCAEITPGLTHCQMLIIVLIMAAKPGHAVGQIIFIASLGDQVHIMIGNI